MSGGTFLSSSAIDGLTTPEDLASLLKTTYKKIKYFYYTQDKVIHYRKFTILKKSGKPRFILAPSPQLKTLQSRLIPLLEVLYKAPSAATAFKAGSSILDNAKVHTRKSYVFNIDLVDFFPTITFARIRGLLISKPYSLLPETATVIAHLATVEGKLPQGAPTSPILSNMICASLDRQLKSLANRSNAMYTRYADDITFSFYSPIRFLSSEIVDLRQSAEDLNHYGCQVGAGLEDIIQSNGFSVNKSKVRLQGKHEKQVVTGLLVNKKVNVDRKYIRKTRALIFSLEVDGVDVANAKNKARNPESTFRLEAHVHGRLLFIHQIKGVACPVYRNLAKRFNALPVPYKAPMGVAVKQDSELSFSKSIVNKCWVIEIPEFSIQGTGFMIEGNLMISCAHVFEYRLDLNKPDERRYAVVNEIQNNKIIYDSCEVHRVNDKGEVFIANVLYRDTESDLAVLSIDSPGVNFDFFRIEKDLYPKVGDSVSVLGFPNYKPNATEVSRFWANVTVTYESPNIGHAEIDKTLYAGNSGGPVLNTNQNVVGVAKRGAAGSPTGCNSIVTYPEIIQLLKDYKGQVEKTVG